MKVKLIYTILILAAFSNYAHSETVGNKYIARMFDKTNESKRVYDKVEKMYSDAISSVKKKDYQEAVEKLKAIQDTYPFATEANESPLLMAYANYMLLEYDKAIADIEYFIEKNINHYEFMDYAMYLRAMIYYKKLLIYSNNAKIALKTKDSIDTLLSNYPNSIYAKDIKLKKRLVLHYIASKDIISGRFYAKKHNCISALLRFQNYIEHQNDSFYSPEVLHRMSVCYLILGLKSESEFFYSTLKHNYPFSIWISKTEKAMEKFEKNNPDYSKTPCY